MVIFFDIDGTLVNHEKASKKAAENFFELHKEIIKMRKEEFVNLWFSLAEKYLNLYFEKKISYINQRIERIKIIFNKFDYEISKEEALAKYDIFLKFYEKNWELFPDVLECLKFFKNIKKGAISNGDFNMQVKKLKKVKIYNEFNDIITSELVKIAKPDKKIFEIACNRLKCKKEESFYVGDKYETDALAAYNAGLKGVWLNRKNERVNKIDKVIEIKSLYELKQIIY